MSNLKQLSLGILQYIQDYDERLPNVSDGSNGANKVGGWVFYSVYKSNPADPSVFDVTQGNIYPYIKNAQVYVCPTDPLDQNASYAINACVVANSQFTTGLRAGKKLAAFPNTADWMLFGEETQSPPNSNETTNDGYYATSDWPSTRHLEGSNLAFLDGHVKWVKPDKMISEGYQYGGTIKPAPINTACP